MFSRGSSRLLAVLLALLPKLLWGAEEVDFLTKVGPLLAKRCAGCHDAAEKKGGLDLTTKDALLRGGDSGPAIIPSKFDDSLLWQRIAAGEMPPKHPLPDGERDLLKAWLAGGASWKGAPLDPLAFTSEQRAGYDWWALQPVRKITPPVASSRALNAIDAFIEQRLASAKLKPSPQADRRTLIRRLYFGLIGLPPTPEEVSAFLNDPSPEAYRRLVEHLLNSPAYGERWARHWLDVARFGESQGFERDKLRLNAWRYRDWVIDAFNRDLPYDEFARLQLAGDVLRPGDAEARIATGFLVGGPYDEVGQQQQSAAMKAVVRQDELEDYVSTVGQTFLGLTVNCARCHDHKFDPIRQTEYYRMAAALAGVRPGEPTLPATAVAERASEMNVVPQERIQAIETRLETIEGPRRRAVLAARDKAGKRLEPPRPAAAWEFNDDARDTLGDLHLELKEGARLRDGKLHLDGKGYAVSLPLKRGIGAKTLEAWVQLLDLEQRGGGVLGLQTLSGSKFDTIAYGEREPRRWIAGSNSHSRTKDLEAEQEDVADRLIHVAVAYHEDGTVAVYRNGRPYGKPYQSSGLTHFDSELSQVVLGLRHAPAEPSKLLRGAVDRAKLYDRALGPEEIAASAGLEFNAVSEAELLAGMPKPEQDERATLRFELDQLQQAVVRLGDRKTYAVAAQTPEATFLLHRGNPGDQGEPTLPGGIASLRGTKADFGLPADASDAERRRRLAEWIAGPDNPLFARVMVNRLWHYHFGVGLVETPNDFGFNGGRPSHPELLDWLAGELVRSGWSIKHVQRLIVTSATYRQASHFRADAAKFDAGNRLLWRKSPQRLEAETLRDALLSFSGELDDSLHGPGFHEFTTFVRNSQFYVMRDAVGPSFNRRTIYRTWVRSARSQLLDVFDCPDPSTKTPQRAVTTTPLQALSLLNNAFVLRTADSFAERIQKEAGADKGRQVRTAFERVLNRTPDAEEQQACEAFVGEFGLSGLCRVMFNSNELLFVD